MNKGIKGIAIVIVIVLALALGLSACDKTEYYSVNVTSNLANDPAVQINVSASKDKNGYQKGESAYVSISVAPGSKYVVESVNAKTDTGSSPLTIKKKEKYNYTVEGNTTIDDDFVKTLAVLLFV